MATPQSAPGTHSGIVVTGGERLDAGLSVVVSTPTVGAEFVTTTLRDPVSISRKGTIRVMTASADLGIGLGPGVASSPPVPLLAEASCPEVTTLRGVLGGASKHATDRQRRLFMVACCRRIWHLLSEERCAKVIEARARYRAWQEGPPTPSVLRRVVELAERAADGDDLGTDLRRWLRTVSSLQLVARDHYDNPWTSAVPLSREVTATCAAASAVATASGSLFLELAASSAAEAVSYERGAEVRPGIGAAVDPDETAAQCDLVRDIFGRPLRLEVADPAWHTPTVLRLARGIYDDRDFGLMPILGDALEDAGCADEAVLSHLRADKPHARGCWVLDLLLGR
jgi:hypothetical protein